MPHKCLCCVPYACHPLFFISRMLHIRDTHMAYANYIAQKQLNSHGNMVSVHWLHVNDFQRLLSFIAHTCPPWIIAMFHRAKVGVNLNDVAPPSYSSRPPFLEMLVCRPLTPPAQAHAPLLLNLYACSWPLFSTRHTNLASTCRPQRTPAHGIPKVKHMPWWTLGTLRDMWGKLWECPELCTWEAKFGSK